VLGGEGKTDGPPLSLAVCMQSRGRNTPCQRIGEAHGVGGEGFINFFSGKKVIISRIAAESLA
jgi:hypothetical protein